MAAYIATAVNYARKKFIKSTTGFFHVCSEDFVNLFGGSVHTCVLIGKRGSFTWFYTDVVQREALPLTPSLSLRLSVYLSLFFDTHFFIFV